MSSDAVIHRNIHSDCLTTSSITYQNRDNEQVQLRNSVSKPFSKSWPGTTINDPKTGILQQAETHDSSRNTRFKFRVDTDAAAITASRDKAV